MKKMKTKKPIKSNPEAESSVVPISDMRVVALALLAQGERARGSGEVEAMQAADTRLRQAEAYADGGAGALVPWAKSPDDLARINNAVRPERTLGSDELVNSIAEMKNGLKTTAECIEKWILNEQGEERGEDTIGRLRAGKMTVDEAAQLIPQFRDWLVERNKKLTQKALVGRARARKRKKEAAEKEAARIKEAAEKKKKRHAQKKNKVALDRGTEPQAVQNRESDEKIRGIKALLQRVGRG